MPWRAMTADEAAAHWLVRRDGPNWSEAEQASFETWLAESEIHRAAFERANFLWLAFEESDDGELLRSMRRSALAFAPEGSKKYWRVAAAACVAVVVFSGLTWFGTNAAFVPTQEGTRQTVAQIPAPVRTVLDRHDGGEFSTARGQRGDVTLPDGTIVTLNTDTMIDVAFEVHRRVVHLLHGQAYFKVAHSAMRPFIVEAADRNITAVGTEFDVRLDPGSLQVLLVKGSVHVACNEDLAGESATAPVVNLRQGERFSVAFGTPLSVDRVADVSSVTSWRRGYVQFNDVPLRVAVAELNRYATDQLVIRDPAVAGLHISGLFRTGDPERFGRVLGSLLPVEVRSTGTGEQLLVIREGRQNAAP